MKEQVTKRLIALFAIVATSATLSACGDEYEFKGEDGAIDHCKSFVSEQRDWSSYHNFSDMKASDVGEQVWIVEGTLNMQTLAGIDITNPISCRVEFVKGFSDDAYVKVL